MLLYSVFPTFAVLDFLLGLLARRLGWYDRCLADIVCEWSTAACAFWIALTLSGIGVAACTVCGYLMAFFRRKGWCGLKSGDGRGAVKDKRSRTKEPSVVPTSANGRLAHLRPWMSGSEAHLGPVGALRGPSERRSSSAPPMEQAPRKPIGKSPLVKNCATESDATKPSIEVVIV